MRIWNPWRGCKKCSDGCLFCYAYKIDRQKGIVPDRLSRTKDFELPVLKDTKGSYKMKTDMVEICVVSDFLLEEADKWRGECWKMIKERSDCTFLFSTKRIARFWDCMPEDCGNGYENVVVCCTIENQQTADEKLAIFQELPIKHKRILAQPLLERVDIRPYLADIEGVSVGGEADYAGRPLDFDWVLDIRKQCVHKKVNFEFRQCGSNYIKEGKHYRLKQRDLAKQARLEQVNYFKK